MSLLGRWSSRKMHEELVKLQVPPSLPDAVAVNEVGRLANVVTAAKDTVDEMLATYSHASRDLVDELLDLRRILTHGVPDA